MDSGLSAYAAPRNDAAHLHASSSLASFFCRWRPTMLEEFKKFALRGNVVDLAVGVIIGAAFGAIVNSMVSDILTPVIGAITGGLDFSNHFIPLSSKVTADSIVEAKKQGAVLAWGSFVTVVINFVIIAWVLFMVIRLMNQLLRSEAEKAPALSKQEMLLTEIRDLLKSSPPAAR
jgi:large conductance mechanosensitive channel